MTQMAPCLAFTKQFSKYKFLVHGNRNLLETALINIFDNASKFSGDGEVRLQASVNHAVVTITVQDNGVGIPKADIPKITQPFFRADNVRQIRGSGIGIPLTLRVVEIHKGTLEVASEINKGTTVTIALPLVPDAG